METEPDDQQSGRDLERALTEAREELVLAREHLVLFAAQVSHDLRTPLTAILANAEMLAGETAVDRDPDAAWMLDAIGRGARRMNDMIERMLDYAREGGAPDRSDTPLDGIFEQALADLAPVVEAKRAEVSIGAMPTLSADGDQLLAVARALLSNALKFSRPEVRPCVAVRSERLPEHWRVTVTDNGVGVPPDRREAMFVLFTRGDKRVDGEGVGLATAKRLVEAHGGRIGMEGAPDGGTTVWFDLPA